MQVSVFSCLAAFPLAVLAACSSGGPASEAREGPPTAAEQAPMVAPAADRVIPLFFLRVTDNPDKLNSPGDGHLRLVVDAANDMYSRAGVRFVFQRVARAMAPTLLSHRDTSSARLTRADVAGVAQALGVPDSWNAGLSTTSADWTKRFEAYNGTNYLTVWMDDLGGGSSEIGDGEQPPGIYVGFSGIELFSHEAGHMFGLQHPFDPAIVSCDFWDLIFNQVSPTTQQFFTSHADCDAVTSPHLHAIDSGGATSDSTGAITITPECGSGCTPITYRTGDPQLSGYARALGTEGKNARNVMDYGNSIAGFPSDGGLFLSESQIEVVRRAIRKNIPNGGQAGYGARTYLGHRISDNPIYPVDFDGDGRRDVVTWTPPSPDCTDACLGTFAVLLSSHLWSRDPANMLTQTLGVDGAQPVVADYDGDGKADLAVFEPVDPSVQGAAMVWRYCPSSLGNDCTRVVSKTFGHEGDVPIPRANFIGTAADGEAAVFTPSDGSWRYGPMCKPARSGKTTCSTGWFGPFLLGDAESTIMPDLWDDDDKTDFAIYNARTATLKVRESVFNYNTTITYNIDGWAVQADSSDPNDANLFEDQLLPMYGPLGGTPRRALGMYSFGRNKWLTQWQWWNPIAVPALCAFATDVPFDDGEFVGGIDYNDDGYTDRVALVPTGTDPIQELRIRPSSSTTCGAGETTVAVPRLGSSRSVIMAVSDMTGDGKPDLLMIDDTAGRLQVLDPHNNFHLYRTITFGGPHTQFY